MLDLFNVELGYGIFGENGDDLQAAIISGTAIPDGVSGKQGDAPIGSLYLRSGTGELYQKVANAGAPADWQLNGASSASIGIWRSETITAVTDEAVVAGVRDLTASPFTDDDVPLLTAADFQVGEFIISDADGTPVLLEVTNVSAPNVTFAVPASAPALSANDTFIANNYLPDSPGAQEGKAIVNYNGSVMLKLADIDFAIATGINLSGSYAAAAGNVLPGDTLEAAVAKLDGVNDAQDTLLGTAQGALDLGTFTGAIISDNNSVKGALQELETSLESTNVDVADLITLSGVPANSTDLGTFTGDIISDNNTIKGALQELETELVDTRDNTDSLITLSGLPENSTDLGTFTGSTISDNTDVKNAFQELETAVEAGRQVFSGTVPNSTPTVLDSVSVDDFQRVTWILVARDSANPARVRSQEINAIHDGHASADATNTDRSISERINIGNVNVQVDVNLLGSAGSQVLQLEVDTNEASGINYTVERASFLPLAG